MKLKKFLAVGVAVMLSVGSLTGCSSSNNASSNEKVSSNKTTSKREERIKNNELIVAIGEEPESGFDATTGGHGSLTKVFFSTLFKRDKELGFENDLATGYKVSDDKLTWTVTIRNDARFTDGEKLTAEDVAFTYETTKKSSTEVDLTMIKEVKAIDDKTVQFTLTRPMSCLLYTSPSPRD